MFSCYHTATESSFSFFTFCIIFQSCSHSFQYIFVWQGLWSREINLNEELVQQGIAVTQCNVSSQTNAYQNLTQKLLKLEIKANQKGHGIWSDAQSESKWERLKILLLSVPKKFIRYVHHLFLLSTEDCRPYGGMKLLV